MYKHAGAGGRKEREEYAMELRDAVQLGGVEFSIETGKVAKQAHGSVMVR